MREKQCFSETEFAEILLDHNADPNIICYCPRFFGGGETPLTLISKRLVDVSYKEYTLESCTNIAQKGS